MDTNGIPPEGVAAIVAALILWAETRLLPIARRSDRLIRQIATKLGLDSSSGDLLLILAVLGALALGAGCVQVVSTWDSRATRAHQDVGRVTSSDQASSVSAEVPVSLIPK